jgi:hypothetical protein
MIRQTHFRGVVHSVFQNALNLASTENLYTLVTDQFDNGPNTLVVEVHDFQAMGIDVGDDAAAADDKLYIGGKVVVILTGAAEWRTPAAVSRCDDEELQDRLAVARAYVERVGTRAGMVSDPRGSLVHRVTAEMLRCASDLLVDALKRQDLRAALTQAGQLIGLGPGLTPSGDDFLMGLLAALAIARPLPSTMQQFCSAVVPMSKAATNAISHAAIRAAAEGEVRECVSRLIFRLCDGNRVEFHSALDDVLGIGSSSGTDIAWGVIRGLEVVLAIGEHEHGTQSRH